MNKLNVAKAFVIVLVMAGCLAVGVWHGTSIGNVKAIMEYELGYNAGYHDALYTRPVPEELEMVCLGLWIASLPNQEKKRL